MNFMGGKGGRSGGGGYRGDIVPQGHEVGQLANFDKRQMGLYKQQFEHLGPDSYLSRLAGGDQSLFGEMEAPALQQFSALQGGMANRFSQGSGGGSTGLRRSSGFQNEGSAASSNFAQQLQAQRQGLQRQAINDLMGMSNTLLNQRPYERDLFQKPPEQPGKNWGGLIGAGVGGAVGLLGGPFGALQGANFGHQIGQAFT